MIAGKSGVVMGSITDKYKTRYTASLSDKFIVFSPVKKLLFTISNKIDWSDSRFLLNLRFLLNACGHGEDTEPEWRPEVLWRQAVLLLPVIHTWQLFISERQPTERLCYKKIKDPVN